MMTITEFLEARIAEDEADARVAEEWANDGPEPYLRWIGEGNDRLVFRLGKAGNHIARHDPARVLAECAAKRALSGLHSPTTYRTQEVCNDCGDWWDGSPIDYPCDTIKIVAAVYAAHPDYRQEWAL